MHPTPKIYVGKCCKFENWQLAHVFIVTFLVAVHPTPKIYIARETVANLRIINSHVSIGDVDVGAKKERWWTNGLCRASANITIYRFQFLDHKSWLVDQEPQLQRNQHLFSSVFLFFNKRHGESIGVIFVFLFEFHLADCSSRYELLSFPCVCLNAKLLLSLLKFKIIKYEKGFQKVDLFLFSVMKINVKKILS